MKDTRSTEIKRILKKQFPNATFRVRIDKYSMGESINVQTNAFHIAQVPDPRGYGYINQASEQDQTTRDAIKRMLRSYESVDRDEATGDILGGGNTYLFVEEL